MLEILGLVAVIVIAILLIAAIYSVIAIAPVVWGLYIILAIALVGFNIYLFRDNDYDKYSFAASSVAILVVAYFIAKFLVEVF